MVRVLRRDICSHLSRSSMGRPTGLARLALAVVLTRHTRTARVLILVWSVSFLFHVSQSIAISYFRCPQMGLPQCMCCSPWVWDVEGPLIFGDYF
jgi:hypothetical protein